MTLIPLKIPAGFYRTGTDLDASGRWEDGSLVRWRDGSLRPVGGWRVNENIASMTTYAPRGMHTWEDQGANRWIASADYQALKVAISTGTLYDITPTGLASGTEDAAINTGYGKGPYGFYAYGTERPDTGNLEEATTWSLDNWGQYLVACSTADGTLYEWQLGTSPLTVAAPIANAPTSNKGLIVTEERFIFALGAGANPRKVQWCDREDNTTWTAAATNEAGDIELQTSGQIQTAIRTRGQTLIITDIDAHTARYIGPPYVYGFERVGTSCGIISRQAAADVDMGVFWMGNGGFYRFDGNLVSEIPCDVHDYVFSDINTAQKSKTWAFTNGQFGEIWWFYQSKNATEIDKYVAYDFKENHWLIGELSRTTGASRGVFEYPMLMDGNGSLYDHEVALAYETNGVDQPIFAQSGPISIGNGDNIMQVTDLIPDEKTQGDVNITFKSRYYPNDTEYTHGPYTPSSPTAVRFSGRQIRMRVEGDTPYAAWRVGTMRVDAKAGGRR
jgi:hypothetical protein